MRGETIMAHTHKAIPGRDVEGADLAEKSSTAAIKRQQRKALRVCARIEEAIRELQRIDRRRRA